MRGKLDRRTLIGSAGAVLVARRAHGQSSPRASIGVLSPFSPAAAVDWHRALEQGLQALGWRAGANLRIEYRHGMGDTSVLPQLADQLLRTNVDVLVTEVTEATQAARKVTTAVPIVMVAVGDPVAIGLVHSLARPGGNVTGLSQNIVESVAKRLELLKTAAGVTEVGVLWNPDDENSALNWRALQDHAGPLGVSLKSVPAQNPAEIDSALAAGKVGDLRALYVVPGPLFVTNLERIAALARERRLASIFHLPEYVHMGGLLAYGPDRADLFRRAAGYVDRLLKGAKPADLPIEQPNKFDLSINSGTAKAIGLAIPRLMLVQASELVE
jgi:putative ABC transport system substrate-binding protein